MSTTEQTALERARYHFPAIYLTLYSIIIALVLERLWNAGGLSLPPAMPTLTWIQIFVYVVAAFYVWLHTSLFAASVATTLRLRDAFSPFLLLFLFNGMLATMDDPQVHWWFYLAALVYLAAFPVWRSWEQAHQEDPGSAAGIGVYRTARYFNLTGGGVFILAGILAHARVIEPSGTVALALVGFVAAFAGGLLWLRGWRRAVGMVPANFG